MREKVQKGSCVFSCHGVRYYYTGGSANVAPRAKVRNMYVNNYIYVQHMRKIDDSRASRCTPVRSDVWCQLNESEILTRFCVFLSLGLFYMRIIWTNHFNELQNWSPPLLWVQTDLNRTDFDCLKMNATIRFSKPSHFVMKIFRA